MSHKDVTHFYVNSAGAKRHEAHTVTAMFLYAQTTDENDKKPRSGSAYRLNIGLDRLDIRGLHRRNQRKNNQPPQL
jgi:PmbA protein